MDAVLGIACPNILFPYVREVISDIVVRAGFPPVMLAPGQLRGDLTSAAAMQPAAGSRAADHHARPSH